MAFAIPMKREFMIDTCCPEHSVRCLWLDSTRFVTCVHREFSSVRTIALYTSGSEKAVVSTVLP